VGGRVSVRRAFAWLVFVAAAFALPATALRVQEGRLFKCQQGCLTPSPSNWPSRQIKKSKLAPAVAKNQNTIGEPRALAVTDQSSR
jgi:hypothetical protein